MRSSSYQLFLVQHHYTNKTTWNSICVKFYPRHIACLGYLLSIQAHLGCVCVCVCAGQCVVELKLNESVSLLAINFHISIKAVLNNKTTFKAQNGHIFDRD